MRMVIAMRNNTIFAIGWFSGLITWAFIFWVKLCAGRSDDEA